jgi:hypothetical protein
VLNVRKGQWAGVILKNRIDPIFRVFCGGIGKENFSYVYPDVRKIDLIMLITAPQPCIVASA